MTASEPVAVLEVGGTHARASWVDAGTWTVLTQPTAVVRLDGGQPAATIIDELARCVGRLGDLAAVPLVVAIPGPFDYDSGVARFHDVGKFDKLYGVDVGTALSAALPQRPARIGFVNDAEAFGLGEWLVGAASGCAAAVAITLGTGVGSAFVRDGRAVTSGPDVPPDGYVHRLRIAGRPLESVVSRRAIVSAFVASGGSPTADVVQIAELAAAGDAAARQAITDPIQRLGESLGPWLTRFGAQQLVVGGGMSRAWSLVEPALRAGLAVSGAAAVPTVPARCPDETTAVGAAWHVVGASVGRDRPGAGTA